MNLLSPVSTIMTTKIVTAKPDDSLLNVKEIFKKYGFHHLPVIDDGKLVGMLSKSDFLFFQRGFNNGEDKFDIYRLKTHRVDQIMTKKLATLGPNEKLNVALEVFKENLFHAIPIVKKKKLVGLLTTFDIITHLADDKGATNKYE